MERLKSRLNPLFRNFGLTIAEVISRWFPTAAAQVRGLVWQVGFLVDKVVSVQVFSEYFGFPCQKSFIPPISPSP
jgi:hypothetical protein